MATVRYYEKMLLMPSECIAVTVSYKPLWSVAAVIPPEKRTVIVGANEGQATAKVRIKTPTLLWVHRNALSKIRDADDSKMFLLAMKNEGKTLYTAPYMIANVHEDGAVCWGGNKHPLNLRAAHSSYFTTPFSMDLWTQQEDYYDDLPDDKEPDETKPRKCFQDFVRNYEAGAGEEGDDVWDESNNLVFGEAHVSFPQHIDAVLISTRPKTLKLFPKEAQREDRLGRPCIIGAAKRVSEGWMVNCEGNIVVIPFDKKAITATTAES